MKKLIIILAVLALSFVGLLIWGGSGSQEPKRPCQQLKQDSDGDYDVPGDWCPPSIAKATRPLQARFAPGLDLEQKKVEIAVSPQADASFVVPAIASDKRRTAKLTLIGGSGAIVHGPNDAKQCLCMPGQPVPAQLRSDTCSADWRSEHERKGWICQKAGKWGTIPIEQLGGTLTFVKGPEARVEVK